MISNGQQLANSLNTLLVKSKSDNETEIIINNFIDYCNKKNLYYLKESIIKHLGKIFNEQETVKDINIYSKHNLNNTEIKKIVSYITREKNVRINKIIDKDIILGFKAEYKNNTYDATINNNLKRLKYNLINN